MSTTRLWLTFSLLGALGCGIQQSGGKPGGDGGLGDGGSGVDGDAPILDIQPHDPVVMLTGGAAPTVTFSATLGGTTVPASFVIDKGELGTVNAQTGLYTAGKYGGRGTVTATYQGQTARTSVTVQVNVTENGDPDFKTGTTQLGGAGGWGGVGGDGPGGPATPAQKTILDGTPTSNATVRILYPYDNTVFPRGILAPLVMWNPAGNSVEAVRVELKSKSGNYHYIGYFSTPAGATSFSNLIIPATTWDQMSFSASGDEVTMNLIFDAGGVAWGPFTRKWLMAPATLKGTVYYNSYNTKLTTGGGAVLAVRPGKTDPDVVAGNDGSCRVCHSVSANGARIITQRGENYDTDSLFDATTGTGGGSGIPISQGKIAFSGLSPDGSVVFSHSSGQQWTDTSSKFYDLNLSAPGAGVSFTGLPSDLRAGMPSFSPDGKQIVFNAFGGSTIAGDGISLGVLDVDLTNRMVSNVRKFYTPTSGIAIWPSFMPTGTGVVFEHELTKTANDNYFGMTWSGYTGNLWWVDVPSGMAHGLDQLNGTGGLLPINTDVPGSDPAHSDDTIYNYEPTVNPIASGGYVWVVFTSRRMYGNRAIGNPYAGSSRPPKKLWISAVDLNATPGQDPSHPAFYLPGQEIEALNSRGFWTTEPCRSDGVTCESGDECCGGYCQPDSTGALVCTAQKPVCAMLSERCTQSGDCCPSPDGAVVCVNGFCALDSPPIP